MRHAFHQASIANEYVGAMIHDVVTGPIKLAREHFFRESHANGIGQTLAERTGRGFNPDVDFPFRMTSGS
jgi:hypothetical protein